MRSIRLTGPSLVYIGAAAVNAVVPFAVLPWFTRWLGPDGFGRVGMLTAMIGVLSVLVGLSTHGQVSVCYFREGPASLPVRVGASVGVLALTTAVLMLALQLGADPLAAATGISAGWLWTVGISACGQFAVSLTLTVWQSRQQVWHYGAAQIGYTMLWAGLSFVLIGFAGMDWTGRALGQAGAAIIATVVCLATLTAAGCIDWNPRRWPIGSAVAFGVPLMPHSLAAIVMSTADRFALSSTVDAHAVGQYFAALQIASVLSMGAAALNQAWIPWMYERLARADEASRREIVRATYGIYGLLAAGAVAMLLGSATLVRVVAGPAFAESAGLLVYLAPAAAFGGMYYVVTGYLFYQERTGLLSMITVSVAALQVVLTFWMARHGGAKGVALAVLLCSFLYWVTTAFVANRISPMPWLKGFRAAMAPDAV